MNDPGSIGQMSGSHPAMARLWYSPESALAYWNGADEPGTGIIPVAEGRPSDYDRACSMTVGSELYPSVQGKHWSLGTNRSILVGGSRVGPVPHT